MASRLSSVLAELRRRKVWQVAGVYATTALGIALAVAELYDDVGLPEGTPRVVIVLLLIGFPIALVLAWAYEVSPEGPEAGSHELSVSEVPTATAAPSIAVLPFRNMSADTEQDYFCEGMAEEIINALARLKDLRVIARTSAFAFKDAHEDVRDIGRKLGVAHLLEGSVRRSDDRLRITAQLIQVTDGSHVWSERYDRTLHDVFDIQDDISLAIVDKLKGRLLDGDRSAVTKRSTESAAAYELYLKAQPHFNRWLRDGIEQAIELLRQALLEDPSYGRAYATLSFCYMGLGFMGYEPPGEAYPKAKAAAQRALELDDRLAEAHTALGMVSHHFNWDRPTAESHFQRAIDLSPGDPIGHIWYGWYLAQDARFDEGLSELKTARGLDPLGVSFGLPTEFYIGEMLYFARRYEEAIEQLRKTLKVNPSSPVSLLFLGLALQEQGSEGEAIEHLEKAFHTSGRDAVVAPFLACIYGLAGRHDEAERILEEIIERGRREYVSAWDVALVQVGLGDVDEAFKWLEQALEQRAGWMVYLKTLPLLDNLRGDPRFLSLQQRVGLEPNATKPPAVNRKKHG